MSAKPLLRVRMISISNSLPGNQAWRHFELHPANSCRSRTRDEFKSAIRVLEKNIAEGTQRHDHMTVLLEDITIDTLDLAFELYNAYPDRFRLFFITTHDLSLIERDFRNHPVSVEVFSITPVTQKDAEIYVTHRLNEFREPALDVINDLYPIFPWTQQGLHRCVEDLGPTTIESPVTLRMLNRNLRGRLEDHHEYIKAMHLPPVGTVDRSRITDYLMAANTAEANR